MSAKRVTGKLEGRAEDPDELAASTSTGLNRHVAAMLAQFANSVYQPYSGELSTYTYGDDLSGFVRNGVLKPEYKDFILMGNFRTVSGTRTRRATLFGLICLKLSPLEQHLLQFASSVVGDGLSRQQAAHTARSSQVAENRIRYALKLPLAYRRELVICFRGTCGSFLFSPDWQTDMDQHMTPTPFGQGKVHQGFLNAYMACRMKIHEACTSLATLRKPSWLDVRAVKLLTPIVGEGAARAAADTLARNTALYITGHSLGGALATLATADLSATTHFNPVLYNFGSPRVGNKTFSRWWNRTIATSYCNVARSHRSWRISRPLDPVTHVPVLSYKHVGNCWSLGTSFSQLYAKGLNTHSMDAYSDLVLYKGGLAPTMQG